MSTGFTPDVVPLIITTSASLTSGYDKVLATITAASTLTLYSANGQFAGYSIGAGQGVARGPGRGIAYVYNLPASTANLSIAPASGESLNGTTDGIISLAPGQNAVLWADGNAWTCFGVGSATGSVAGGGIQTAVVPLNSAQILALNATPVSLIASPGSGKCIFVDNISFKMVTTATTYANGGALEFRYTNASGTKVTADIASAVITAAAATSFTNVRGIEASLTGTAAAAITVSNATAPFITGTGAGVFVIDYHVV